MLIFFLFSFFLYFYIFLVTRSPSERTLQNLQAIKNLHTVRTQRAAGPAPEAPEAAGRGGGRDGAQRGRALGRGTRLHDDLASGGGGGEGAATGGPAGTGLPCSRAPDRCPRGERTGCRPPWPRRGRATHRSAAPRRPPRLPLPSRRARGPGCAARTWVGGAGKAGAGDVGLGGAEVWGLQGGADQLGPERRGLRTGVCLGGCARPRGAPPGSLQPCGLRGSAGRHPRLGGGGGGETTAFRDAAQLVWVFVLTGEPCQLFTGALGLSPVQLSLPSLGMEAHSLNGAGARSSSKALTASRRLTVRG